MITTAPPLTASFMTTDLSFAKDFIAFLSTKDMLYLIFVLDLVVGIFCRFSTYFSNAALRDHVASTLIRRHFTSCPAGNFCTTLVQILVYFFFRVL